jgi:hypothetical protein
LSSLSWFNVDNDIHKRKKHDDPYLLFGNVEILRDDEKAYQGLAIKLFHGVLISFDARLLYHGTTIARCNCNFGGFVIVGNTFTASTSPN